MTERYLVQPSKNVFKKDRGAKGPMWIQRGTMIQYPERDNAPVVFFHYKEEDVLEFGKSYTCRAFFQEDWKTKETRFILHDFQEVK